MATTPNMNLDLPDVSITIGPLWATKLNAALELVDAHDHTNGKGPKITPSALNINSQLDMQSNKLVNLFSSQYSSQSSPLTGAPNALSVHVSGGNLYYTNAGGTAVQITSGGSLVASAASANSFSRVQTAVDLTILSSDTFVVVSVDSSAPRTITLPSAASVVAGRIFIIKDQTGNSHVQAITITPNGGDSIDQVAGSITLNSQYGSYLVSSDGVSNWELL